MDAFSDLTVGEALADHVENAFFLGREARELGVLLVELGLAQTLEYAFRDIGIEKRSPSTNCPDRVDQIMPSNLFEDEPCGASHDRVEQGLVVGERRQHDD